MNKFKNILVVALFALLVSSAAFGQAVTVTTTTAASVGINDLTVTVTSATGIVAQGPLNQTNTELFIDREVMQVTTVTGTVIGVRRGQPDGTPITTHANGAKVWVGPPNYFGPAIFTKSGSCTAANEINLPRMNTASGKPYDCVNGLWMAPTTYEFYVPPTQCTFAPTTSTVTNTYPQVGASTLFVLNGTTNSAAGTTTLTCNILIPTYVAALRGATIKDITLFVGSQTTAPTSLGTSTLGSITFPAAATSETASTVTPVAIGGTVTTVSPTAISTVTTAGAFLTIKHTYATAVQLSTDLQVLQYTMPFLQSATAVMTLNTPGLVVHYSPGIDSNY